MVQLGMEPAVLASMIHKNMLVYHPNELPQLRNCFNSCCLFMLPRVAFSQNESYFLKVAVFFLKEVILLRKSQKSNLYRKTKIN